jgi:hypothetical protein
MLPGCPGSQSSDELGRSASLSSEMAKRESSIEEQATAVYDDDYDDDDDGDVLSPVIKPVLQDQMVRAEIRARSMSLSALSGSEQAYPCVSNVCVRLKRSWIGHA